MVKIRLRRMGATNRAFYRVVVSDSRNATTSSAIEEIGTYDPRQNPPQVVIDKARVDYWIANGAKLSDSVRELVARAAAERQPPDACARSFACRRSAVTPPAEGRVRSGRRRRAQIAVAEGDRGSDAVAAGRSTPCARRRVRGGGGPRLPRTPETGPPPAPRARAPAGRSAGPCGEIVVDSGRRRRALLPLREPAHLRAQRFPLLGCRDGHDGAAGLRWPWRGRGSRRRRGCAAASRSSAARCQPLPAVLVVRAVGPPSTSAGRAGRAGDADAGGLPWSALADGRLPRSEILVASTRRRRTTGGCPKG
jgi:small subunit ribosomal protein S16